MNKYLKVIYLLLFTFCFQVVELQSQTDFGSEQEFKKEAGKLFEDEEFVKAYPLYTQLVSLYKKDPDYNYRLGVCMLYSVEDKEKAIPYLEFALKSPDEIEKEAYFYLAKAYHLNYRFDDAVRYYKAYKKVASGAKAERLQVDRQMEMCANGKSLLRNLSDLQVLEKTEMGREDFFRTYNISTIGGKLLVKPDEKEFRTSLDKKKKESSILYLVPGGSTIYFSSYGENEKNGKDIYQINKTSSGEWGNPQPIGNGINTKYDEDFPFMHPNGKVLYFCSKGHNSMGGYDVFKSTLNEKNEWSAPVNLDFPINTPDDDILYITDKEEKTAYFSSARASEAGKIAVYNINVERKALDFVFIRGKYLKNRDRQSLNAKITIKNLSENNSIVGIFNTTAEDGVYDIRLPNNGGKFLFTVEAEGFLPQSEAVEVPVQKEFKPLRQELSFDGISDKLIIKNFFDESLSDTSYMMSLALIKEKSKLSVSPPVEFASTTEVEKTPTTSTNTIDSTTIASSTKTDTTAIPAKELSNADIVRIGYKDAKEAEAEAKEVKEQADISWAFANQKNELAQAKLAEAKRLTDAATKEEDGAKKAELTEQAENVSKEAQLLNEETVAAFNIAKKIDATAMAKQEEADLSMQYAKGLDAAVNSSNSKDAIAKLDELEKKLEALSANNAESMPIINSFKKDEENKKRELDRAIKETNNLKQDIADNETIIAGLKVELETERNDKIKQSLTNQIELLSKENVEKQQELPASELKVARLEKEYNSVKNEMLFVSNVVNQSQSAEGETLAAQAATIDKNKLEQQVNTLKTETANVVEPTTSTTATTNTTAVEPTTNTIAVEPTTNTTNSIDSALVVKTDITTPIVNTTTANVDTEAGFAYSNPAASAQVKEAEGLEKEVNELVDQSIELAVVPEGTSLSKAEQKDRKRQSEQVAKQAQEKKAIAEQLYASANSTEFTTNQQLLDAAAEANAGSDSPDAFKAELLNDEAKKYFELAQVEREKANKLKKYSEKEAAWDAAKSNESIALEKQKEAALIYANIKETGGTTPVVAQTNTTTETAVKTNNASASGNQTYGTVEVAPLTSEAMMATVNAKYEADLEVANSIKNEEDRERNKAEIYKSWTNEINNDIAKQKQQIATTTDSKEKAELEKRLQQSENTAKEKQDLAVQSQAKAEAIEQNLATTRTTTNTTPTNTNTVEPTNTNVIDDNEESPAYDYSDPVANQQVEKAVQLNDEADALLAESILSESESTDNTSKEKAIKLIEQAQSKKVEASELLAAANGSEYQQKQKQVDDLAKSNTGNKSSDILKAEILNDESQTYFNTAKEQRLKASTTTDFNEKENLLAEAQQNELLALNKKNQAISVYKNTTAVTTSATTDLASTSASPDSKKQFAYSSPSALEQSVKASSLNKQAEDLMTQSLDLKTQAIAQSNADAKNTMYAQSEELMKEARAKKIQAAQLIAEANASEFNANKQQIVQYKKETAGNDAGELLKAEVKADEGEDVYANAQTKRKEASTLDSYYAKESLLEEAAVNEIGAIEKQKEAIAIYQKYKPNFVATSTNTTKNNRSLITDNQLVASNSSSTISELILAPNEAFEERATDVYSAKNPIPIDSKIPEGLVFKVQVGAFRKAIPQNLFKGITPLTGETTAKGYIRYTAGVFTKFTNADKAKRKIIEMGYKDAFVVAFLNGKRIPINEAYALAGGTPTNVLEANQTINTTSPNIATNTRVDNTNTNENAPGIAKANDLTTIGGLFYTVQVGVYAEPVKASKLYNMSPLYNEKVPSSYIRYYTGIYTSVARASEAKEMIADVGIKDAFITAYYNGKRITVADAQKYEREGAVFPSSSEVNKLPSFGGNTTNGASSVNNSRNNSVATNNTAKNAVTKPTVSGVVYKIQIGAFKEEVPLDIANKFLTIAKKGIETTTDANGLTVYTVGNCSSYEDASTLKAEVDAADLKDSFIVAFKNGQKVALEDVR